MGAFLLRASWSQARALRAAGASIAKAAAAA